MTKLVCSAFAAMVVAVSGPAMATWDPANGDWGKTSASDIRVMTFNIRDAIRSGSVKNSTTNNWHACARIVALLQPDVLVIQEAGDNGCFGCGDSVAVLTDTFEEFIHGGPGVTVFVQAYAPGYDLPHIFVSSETDTFNRNVVLSKFPFTDLNGDTRVAYSDIPTVSPSATWAPGGDGGIRGFQFTEIDLPNVTYSGNLVVGGAHLKSGSGSSDQAQRLDAAQNVAWVIEQWYNGAGTGLPDPSSTISDSPPASTILGPNTPVVIGGDWNEDEGTNGRRGPEAWLSEAELVQPTLDGTDRDRTDMASTFGAVTDLQGDPDTRGGSTLDYLAWQDSITTLRRGLIFNSANIGALGYPTPSPEWDGIAFPSGLSGTASDHLAVFVDLIMPLGTPEGACCDGVSCTILSEADCMNAGGFYQGDDTLCLPNPCIPMGACCTFGNCTIETQTDCFNMGGTYQGDFTDCDPNPCPPAGACCNQGACLVRTQAECDTLGGTYQGDGTVCTPNPCPQVGGCCILGVCSIATEADCISMSGAYLGDNTDCAGAPCGTIGACCFSCDPSPQQPCPDATGGHGPVCVDVPSADCSNARGIYRGDGTTCASGICTCVGDLNGDGSTDVFDFGSFSANFGGGTPDCVGHAQGDLDCNGVVDVFDFGIFAGDFGCQ